MDDLRKLKKKLLAGSLVRLREQLEVVKAKQGPHEHKRCSEHGLVISVVSTDCEPNNLTRWIDAKKYVYITRDGNPHPEYATVSEYQVIDPSSEVSEIPKLEISKETLEEVKTKSKHALAWGLVATATKVTIWCAKHITSVKVLVLIPVVVFVSSLAGITPDSMGMATQWLLRLAGFNGLADTLYVSQIVITNVWFWRFLVGLSIWQLAGFFIMRRQEVDDKDPSPKPVTKVPSPSTAGASAKSKKTSEVSSRGSGEDDPWATSPQLGTCFAGRIMLEGISDRWLDTGGCKKSASFIVPLAGTDKIADFPGKKPGGIL